jgi:hypothetical protein
MKINIGDRVKADGVTNRLRSEYAEVTLANKNFVRLKYQTGEEFDWPIRYIMEVEKKGE